jgi:adenosylcobinamide amidohydrolase
MISTGVAGGGLGERRWWLNSQVPEEYFNPDPPGHVQQIAADLGLREPGVGMITAADVRFWAASDDGGVRAASTVGLGLPVFAAASPERIDAETAQDPSAVRAPAEPAVPGVTHLRPGTVNVLVIVPVPLSDGALVNAVLTATEAKVQALTEHAVPGTGTSSDALCIACPSAAGRAAEPYGGPRSTWGARIARAVHAGVTTGTEGWLRRHPDGDPHRPWRLGGDPAGR